MWRIKNEKMGKMQATNHFYNPYKNINFDGLKNIIISNFEQNED